MIKLSICIPTYNRDKYLKELLDSIINQIDYEIKDKVEICISDNLSIDNTQMIVKEYIDKKIISIKYNRNLTNIGAERNFFKSVEIAEGEFCWIIGSDDKVKDGLLKYVLKQLYYNNDISVYIANFDVCDINMKFMYKRYNLRKGIIKSIYDFSKENDIKDYLNYSTNQNALGCFISISIFNRKQWNKIGLNEKTIGTGYPHVYNILKILLNSNGKLKYINKSIVLYRCGNDSFFVDSKQRLFLDFKGIPLIAKELGLKGGIKKYYLKLIIKHYPCKEVAIRQCVGDFYFNKDEKLLLKRIGYSSIQILLFSKIFIKFLKFIRIIKSYLKIFIKR